MNGNTKSLMALLLAAAMCVGAVGCMNDGDGDSTTDGVESDSTESELVAESADQPGEDLTEMQQEDRDEPEPEVAEPTLADVDERAASQVPTIDDAMIDGETAERVDEIELPVLLPDDEQLLEAGELYGVDHTYTFTIHVDNEAGERDHTITVRGSRMRPDLPDELDAEDSGEDGEYQISETHLVQSLAFDRFDAAYTIDVECNRPHENETCNGHDYITSIADSMGMVSSGR